MEKSKKAYLLRDKANNILADATGLLTCICEDEFQFSMPSELIDFNNDVTTVTVNGTYIDIMLNAVLLPRDQETDTEKITSSVQFVWNDAAVKLFVTLYKEKKELVSTKKIKTQKIMWKDISSEMNLAGYNVTPLQIENKWKSMECAYKNMISNNKKTGRGRSTCSYESELAEILGKRHNIVPLAISGREGLVVREDAAHCNSIMPVPATVQNLSSSLSEQGFEGNNAAADVIDEVIVSREENTKVRSTAKSLEKCQEAIEQHTQELRNQKLQREEVQSQMLEEYKKNRIQNEEFMKKTEEYRQQKLDLLQNIVKLLKVMPEDV